MTTVARDMAADLHQTPIAMYVRYSARVTTYALFLRGEYPPFSFDTSFPTRATIPGYASTSFPNSSTETG